MDKFISIYNDIEAIAAEMKENKDERWFDTRTTTQSTKNILDAQIFKHLSSTDSFFSDFWDTVLQDFYSYFGSKIKDEEIISSSDINQFFGRRYSMNKQQAKKFLCILKQAGYVKRCKRGYKFFREDANGK